MNRTLDRFFLKFSINKNKDSNELIQYANVIKKNPASENDKVWAMGNGSLNSWFGPLKSRERGKRLEHDRACSFEKSVC